ncbi:MAG: phosphohydrolase [Bacteroidales bacterium]
MMSYITTFTGLHFDPVNPSPELVCLEDIAHALSMICRANGHTRIFYSVAQHSLGCCKEAELRGHSFRIQLGCLLHDASEAYLSDMPRPIKAQLPEYIKAEDQLQNMIWNLFFDPPLTKNEKEIIFEIDNAILSYEFIHLMPESLSEEYQKIISGIIPDYEHPSAVKQEFLYSVETLGKRLSEERANQ